MENHSHTLWNIYQSASFLLTQHLSPHAHFAIITAYNPLGELLDACQNRLLDRQLLRDIEALGVPYRALIGTNDQLSHMEKSWAVFLEQEDSIRLAHKYRQNALYYVMQDELMLLPCRMGSAPQTLGSFRSRVRLVHELPELVPTDGAEGQASLGFQFL
ncbi:DUF3293 domain-containing protein [Shewanella litorisediminis]|uniref:DUF3293 domain-containing protein n=1 Tax=Shewanella litorisediminis TaxID=1173586 RepID=A0ABX7G4V0_9GAMM|nr:DUF3293 domain-containing protein [Shewanella litorisediminis]MCL2917934.1 DUF3293 domain-containing protein [Shewanella litorisediminis]QRH02369.1 DUF3293 domain-containing protein [Shewanella litorisediminis]